MKTIIKQWLFESTLTPPSPVLGKWYIARETNRRDEMGSVIYVHLWPDKHWRTWAYDPETEKHAYYESYEEAKKILESTGVKYES